MSSNQVLFLSEKHVDFVDYLNIAEVTAMFDKIGDIGRACVNGCELCSFEDGYLTGS